MTAPADPLALLHPGLAAWFAETFPEGPTAAQRAAWPEIAAGKHVLLVSPTGTGKTLAAFLVALDRIVRAAERGERRGLRVLYVSPLKALDNDIHRNLEAPREAIAERLGVAIAAAVRTGDTPSSARAAQAKRPPDVLITTPESLYLLLTSPARRILAGVDTVILDEVHAVAGTKRGTHLSLSLERLEEAIAAAGGKSPQRVALSATVSPVERIAAFVGGTGRKVTPLVVPARKELDLTVASPLAKEGEEPASAWGPAADLVAEEVAKHRTTLVFCNNRRHAERVSAMLSERLRKEVPAHHGSVARAPREAIERKLKSGALKALVATGSLELGIDVGEIDAVVQVSSPKGVARALQRVGRSGHLVGQTSRGVFLPLWGEDLLECAAVAEGMREGDVEATNVPSIPLDVLAQQLVAEAVARKDEEPPLTADALFRMARRAAPYADLPRSLFVETLAMLSGKYPKERFAELAPKLVWDRATDRVAPLPAAPLAARLDGGAIADRGMFRAVLPDRKTVVGELDEEFVYEARLGDVFVLGSRAFRVREITHDRVVVEEATGAPAKMPFWRGEGIGRTPELGARIGRLKRFVAERRDDPDILSIVRERTGCTEDAAADLVGAVRREAEDPGGLATDARVVFETFPNDLGDPCLVVRSVFGRAVNLPWSVALASVLREETGVDVEMVTADEGILMRLPRAEREVPLERVARMTAAEARERILAVLPNTALFGARFRENAQRALLLPRNRSGKRTPFWLQRLKARDLLQTTRSLPDFPVVAETYRDCLRDLWRMDELTRILTGLESGAIERATNARRLPSPSAQSLLFGFIAQYIYEWDAPKAEKGIHALAMNRELLGEVLGERLPDAVRPEAAAEARAEASRLLPHRMARTPDELLLVFQELGDLTESEAVERTAGDGAAFLAELLRRGSLARVVIAEEERLVAAEERGRLEAPTPEGRGALVLRFIATRGPASAGEIASRYGWRDSDVESALEALRAEGLAVRGRFGSEGKETLWASAHLAEVIRRKTLGILRREIRPVPLEVFRAFLAKRQGAALGARFTGAQGAEHAVALLRGLPLPFLSWESAVLPSRLEGVEPDALDRLAQRGLLAFRAEGKKDASAARLMLFFRGEEALFLPGAPPDLSGLSPAGRAVYEELALSGASFASDLARTRWMLPPEVDRALLDLTLAGLVTADGLEGLRDLMRRRAPRAPRESETPREGRRGLRAAEARVAERLGLSSARLRLYQPGTFRRAGRFALLSAPALADGPLRPDERAEAWARILLARWGVVSRAVLEREEGVRWGEVSPVLARLEMRGDLRRGEFVAGGGPIQYAEEESVEALRRMREKPHEALAVLGGADPILHGLEPSAARDDLLVLDAGVELLRLTPAGILTLAPELPDGTLRAALGALRDLKRKGRDPLGRPRRLTVASVNGREVAASAVAPLLESLGFTRSAGAYAFRAL